MIKKHCRVFWLDFWVGKKRIRRSLKTDERALAIERAQAISEELKRGRTAGVALAEFIPKYLAWSKDTKESYLSEKYQAVIIQEWFAAAGVKTLNEITPYLIEQFRIGICSRDRRSTKNPKANSKDNANRYCALLRVMFNRARDCGMFDGPNPVKKVKFYGGVKELRVLTDEEKGQIIAVAEKISTAADPRHQMGVFSGTPSSRS
jgi:hypothetical protein